MGTTYVQTIVWGCLPATFCVSKKLNMIRCTYWLLSASDHVSWWSFHWPGDCILSFPCISPWRVWCVGCFLQGSSADVFLPLITVMNTMWLCKKVLKLCHYLRLWECLLARFRVWKNLHWLRYNSLLWLSVHVSNYSFAHFEVKTMNPLGFMYSLEPFLLCHSWR